MTFYIAFKFAQICDKTGNSATPWQIFCHSLHFIKTEEAVELAMSPPTSNSVNNPFLFIFILHLVQSCCFFPVVFFWKLKNMSSFAKRGDRRCSWYPGADGRELCSSMWLVSYIIYGKETWEFFYFFFFASDKPEIQTVDNLFSHLLSQCETMTWIGYLWTDFSKFFPIKSICKSVHPEMLRAVCLSPCR